MSAVPISGDLLELALQLRTQPACCQFLHPIRDRPHQQLATEPWRRRRLVETAPQLLKFAKVELGEARERLLGDPVLAARHSSSPLAGRFDRSKPVHGLVIGILAPRHLATGFAQSADRCSHSMWQPTKPLPDLRD